MFVNGFELSVEVNGSRIPEYGHKGLTYVAGRKGHYYQIKFRNNRPERVLVVPSVDGLSTVEGQPAHGNSSGYVVQGYSSLTVRGWRTSMTEVRQFEFTDRSGSYAGKTQGQQNCGVIGVLVYAEQPPAPVLVTPVLPYDWPTAKPSIFKEYTTCASQGLTASLEETLGTPVERCLTSSKHTPAQAFNACCSAPDFNLGTGYGSAATDCVTQAYFQRGLVLATLEIFYSDREGLLKDGIQVDKTPVLAAPAHPQAFGGFCKPPPA
jgi:hypothetical protein